MWYKMEYTVYPVISEGGKKKEWMGQIENKCIARL